MTLNAKQRTAILFNIRKHVLKSHYNVAGIDYNAWLKSLEERTPELLTGDVEAFETGVEDVLKELGSSHTGFYSERPSRLLPQHTINATLGECAADDQRRWFFLDVFEDGPADRACIRPGDILHRVDGVDYFPPNMPPVKPGASQQFSISAPDGSAVRQIVIDVPTRKGDKNLPPILPPKSISSAMVQPGIGLLRITWFPGAMGLRFSKELDCAIAGLKAKECDRLIVDLRGNIGGGLGFARLASYLCPNKVPIGYSLTPKRQRTAFRPSEFKHVVYPNSLIGFAITLSRFAFRDKSIFLMTQGLGPQPFHGRVVFLVNEWTNSAAEIVASFASVNELATIIGTKTPGNALGAVNMKVGGGYWLRLPVFGWHASDGESLEGRGVRPNFSMQISATELSRGIDSQLNMALAVFSQKLPASPTVSWN